MQLSSSSYHRCGGYLATGGRVGSRLSPLPRFSHVNILYLITYKSGINILKHE